MICELFVVVDGHGASLLAGYGSYAVLVDLDLGLLAVHGDGGRGDVGGSACAAHSEGCSGMAHDGHLLTLALLPAEAYGEVTHGLHASHCALRLPHGGQGGEDVDVAVCTLHEHLCNTRAYTEVTVDLEGSV